jgi:hypothetical protein
MVQMQKRCIGTSGLGYRSGVLALLVNQAFFRFVEDYIVEIHKKTRKITQFEG